VDSGLGGMDLDRLYAFNGYVERFLVVFECTVEPMSGTRQLPSNNTVSVFVPTILLSKRNVLEKS
jgi:hypothetical protein